MALRLCTPRDLLYIENLYLRSTSPPCQRALSLGVEPNPCSLCFVHILVLGVTTVGGKLTRLHSGPIQTIVMPLLFVCSSRDKQICLKAWCGASWMLMHRWKDVKHRIPTTPSHRRVLSFLEKTLSP
ncbi:hypothetical protein VNO77_03292 [Canavalia gladiata]|uniref:Uncharacterized protein n=1 Tax=Canavalia gladiata TaxID=3824 RepID=A0AAN9MUL5_CANGL